MTAAFSTKTGTLAQLRGRVRSARIAPLVWFTVQDWVLRPMLRSWVLPLAPRASLVHPSRAFPRAVARWVDARAGSR